MENKLWQEMNTAKFDSRQILEHEIKKVGMQSSASENSNLETNFTERNKSDAKQLTEYYYTLQYTGSVSLIREKWIEKWKQFFDLL